MQITTCLLHLVDMVGVGESSGERDAGKDGEWGWGGGGTKGLKCHEQPVPNNGHNTGERPVAPYTSACCLWSHRIQIILCTEERRERSGLYPWGTGFCRYCAIDWSCFCVQLNYLSYYTWQG